MAIIYTKSARSVGKALCAPSEVPAAGVGALRGFHRSRLLNPENESKKITDWENNSFPV